MSNQMDFPNGCSEKFAELCALSTTGELSIEESAELHAHISTCLACAELIDEYTSLAHSGMARLAPEFAPAEQGGVTSIRGKQAEQRLISALHSEPAISAPQCVTVHAPVRRVTPIRRIEIPAAAVAALLICVTGAFELGRKTTAPQPIAKVVSSAQSGVSQVGTPGVEKSKLQSQLAAAQASLADITDRLAKSNQQIQNLAESRQSLLDQIAGLTQKDGSDSTSLATVSAQRDSLQQQLTDATSALSRVRDDLTRAQSERQGALYREATLETEVNDLHTELASANTSAGSDEKFLAADRDIRELMGARELYISDVFDVQNNGQRSQPFGRVFYTKGKSLIFYAFDLQAQPGYREAKAFQAWGKPDSVTGKPISLGIFYQDSAQNRRWIVKSADPNVLAQINAVFVTVEPNGGSARPTGKPFLEAYLHSLPPNHP
jgi:anti-sigma-K factor RskA